MTELTNRHLVLLKAAAIKVASAAIELQAVLAELQEPAPTWDYPVGNADFPTEDWHCACWHGLMGAKNDGYAHTGVDLNVDKAPWGDVDRGQPVWPIAPGIVYAIGYSQSYLGSVVIEIEHDGAPLWVRYWHLENTPIFRRWRAGDAVLIKGPHIGVIGNYQLGRGGDHCHLDMCRDPFGPHWWHTRHDLRWVDLVPVLKAHLDLVTVVAMLAKKGR